MSFQVAWDNGFLSLMSIKNDSVESLSVACIEGGKRGDGPGLQTQGVVQSVKLQKLKCCNYIDDFFYCRPANTCCMDLIFRNLFFANISFYVFKYRIPRLVSPPRYRTILGLVSAGECSTLLRAQISMADCTIAKSR